MHGYCYPIQSPHSECHENKIHHNNERIESVNSNFMIEKLYLLLLYFSSISNVMGTFMALAGNSK